MFKNLTVRQLTFIICSIIVLITATFIPFTTSLQLTSNIWILWIIAFMVSLFFSYVVASRLLEMFVFRKIKLIYKLIHDFKVTSRDHLKDGKVNQSDIDEVKDQVASWIENTTEEISLLKKLEEYRRNFLGNISHELKTPIFSIQGYLHTLLDGGLADNKINIKYIKRAVANAERLQTIAEDLEVINRLESQEATLELNSFDIRKLTEEVINDLQFQAKDHNITLSFVEDADLSFEVIADRDEIRQVLINLIINAIKYGRAKGWVKIGFYDMEERILIEVSDNGIGISEKHLNHLFDRFYRVDTSRSRKLGGSGLGLSIVKHIIEAHQESISVKSSPEVGTTFGFTLKKS